MGDVAQILGVVGGGGADAAAAAAPPVDGGDRAAQLQALPKPVLDLLVAAPGGSSKKTKSSHNSSGGGQCFDLPPLVPASGYGNISNNINNKHEESQPTESSQVGSDHNIQDADDTKNIVVKVGNKWIASQKQARPWVWAPFASSSRTDGLLLHHWVRANVEYPDYPFSRFDIHMDPVTYENDLEYQQHLQCPEWSKSETDLLLKLAQTYELRWPVIYDRWMEHFGYHYDASSIHKSNGSNNNNNNNFIPPNRKLEDLQHRYYSVAATLLQIRISAEAAAEAQHLASQTAAMSNNKSDSVTSESDRQRSTDALLIETAAARALATMAPAHQPVIHHHGSGTSNKLAFDLAYERERRAHMEALWNRTPAEEREELELRKELKQVEAQLRKLKKAGLHIIAASNTNNQTSKTTTINANTLASSRNPSRTATPVNATATMMIGGGGGLGSGSAILDPTALPLQIDRAIAGTAPVAVPGTPYLQSARLVGPTAGGPHGINPIVLQRLADVLNELKVPVHPLPTKRACDLYDVVRRDTLMLLLLQKTVLQEEGSLERKRLQLAQRSSSTSISSNGSPPQQPQQRAVADEETLLGIAPAPVPSPAPSPLVATAQSGGAGSNRGAAAPGSKRASLGVTSSGGGGGSKGKNAAATATTSVAKAKNTAVRSVDGIGSAVGGKPAPAGAKQSGGSTKSSSAAGKQTLKPAPAGGKQSTAGGKQPRKASTKRKRKTETQAVAAAPALQPATATTATAGMALATVVPPTVPSAVAATSTAAPPEKAVKRPKKTG